MIYKYKVGHRINFVEYVKTNLSCIVKNIPNIIIDDNNLKESLKGVNFSFVVGCGHSGTTLISGKLGNHQNVFLVKRESQIFLPKKGLLYGKSACEQWYYIAKQLGMTHVLEKTPKHVHCINRIKSVLPESKFILITRNPADNIASLYERFNDLEFCIERWIMDNKELYNWIDSKSTYLIKYKELTKNPKEKFREICDFLNLPWNKTILKASKTSYEKGNLDTTGRKRYNQVSKEIYCREGRWKETLSEDQYDIVVERTSELANKLDYVL